MLYFRLGFNMGACLFCKPKEHDIDSQIHLGMFGRAGICITTTSMISGWFDPMDRKSLGSKRREVDMLRFYSPRKLRISS